MSLCLNSGQSLNSALTRDPGSLFFFFSSECYITEIRYISHPAFNITVHKHLKGVDDKSEDKSSFYSEKTKTNLLGLFPSSSRSEQIQM